MQEILSHIGRWLFAIATALFALLEPTLPYIIVCVLFILADCFTAFRLDRRVAADPTIKTGKNAGKFKSHHFGTVILTMLKAMSLIVLMFLTDTYILRSGDEMLTRIAAGAIIGWQLWSILENESSCNGAKWAKIAQKIFVDKTERHLDVDLSELKNKGYDSGY